MRVGASQIQGAGVFATEDIARGSVVHVLGGDRMSWLRCGARILTGRMRFDDPLQIGRREFIELDALSVAFNHSCAPNCGLRNDSELFALTDIPAGDELTYDYSLTVRPNVVTRRWQMSCNCGAPTCRRVIGNVLTVSGDALDGYLRMGALQEHMRPLVAARRRAVAGVG